MSARRARRADTDEIVRLAAGMFTEINTQSPGADWHRAARDAVHRRVDDDLFVFVIDHPDRPSQLIALAAGIITDRLPTMRNPSGRVGYVQWGATDPDWRRRGFAREVMIALLARFDADQIAMDELHTSPDARGLYTSLDFTEAPHPSLRRYPPRERVERSGVGFASDGPCTP